MGTPSCSRQQPATDNDVRDGRSNGLVASPTLIAVPSELHLLHGVKRGRQISRLAATTVARTRDHGTGIPDRRSACVATQGYKENGVKEKIN